MNFNEKIAGTAQMKALTDQEMYLIKRMMQYFLDSLHFDSKLNAHIDLHTNQAAFTPSMYINLLSLFQKLNNTK